MFANAVVMQGPRDLEMTSVALKSPQQNEAVVQIKHSVSSHLGLAFVLAAINEN